MLLGMVLLLLERGQINWERRLLLLSRELEMMMMPWHDGAINSKLETLLQLHHECVRNKIGHVAEIWLQSSRSLAKPQQREGKKIHY
jgi:hypothetical protein